MKSWTIEGKGKTFWGYSEESPGLFVTGESAEECEEKLRLLSSNQSQKNRLRKAS